MNTRIPDAPEPASPAALICCPDPRISRALTQMLHSAGWQTVLHESAEPVGALPESLWPLVVVVESRIARLATPLLEALGAAIQAERTQVVVIAEHPSTADAMHCTRLGATAYLAWPVLPSALVELAERARRLLVPGQKPSLSQTAAGKTEHTLIGASRAMLELSVQLVRVARAHELSVFISGETGSGKEVIARQIHQESGRTGPFHAINCSAMVESLLESELFGHEKGAFTGAMSLKKGLWEEAAGGTLFLDEITEASPAMQTRLLRVMQEGVIRRVGATREIPVTARIIAAANRDLPQAIREKVFREDLYYRFREVLRVPPLRERLEDVPLLAEYFCQRAGRGTMLTPEAMQLLCQYHWPGNVRELENVITRLAAHCGSRIFPDDLQRALPLPEAPAREAADLFVLSVINAVPRHAWPTAREFRRRYVSETWHRFGSVRAASLKLEMDYRTVIGILEEAGLLTAAEKEAGAAEEEAGEKDGQFAIKERMGDES